MHTLRWLWKLALEGSPPTLCSSSSQHLGTAAGEVAAADANVAPPTKGH